MKRCALYTRVSTAMQAEKDYGSCEAQRDKILSYVKSQEDLEVFKEYSDPGFTGSNLDRPGLKALLNDIAEKKVDVVLTYKIDRLTRSSKDFYSLIEFFEQHGVSYVSVTEHFDTSSPSGRLLRNIMLTFAQFEREMIADRVKNTMLQRAEKGFWNGGGRPFGYKLIDKKLVIDNKEAIVVKQIFERFVKTGSLVRTMEFIRENNFKENRWLFPSSLSGIAALLRNVVYLGHMKWGKIIYPNQHEAIISKELFEEAQRLTKDKVRKKRLYKKFLLGGLVKCSECGSTMSATYTNKPERRYYYYMCTKVTKYGKHACSIKEINAEKLENFVIDYLSRISNDNQYIENLAFKITHEKPLPKGVEPRESCSKKAEELIHSAMASLKEDISQKTQLEKCLILRKTIKRINYSKESLEVVISLGDRAVDELVEGPGKMAARIHGGVPNPTAPACMAKFNFKKWCAQ